MPCVKKEGPPTALSSSKRRPFSRNSGCRKRSAVYDNEVVALRKRSSSLPDGDVLNMEISSLTNTHVNSTAPVSSFASPNLRRYDMQSCSSSPSHSNYPSYNDLSTTVPRKRSLSVGDNLSMLDIQENFDASEGSARSPLICLPNPRTGRRKERKSAISLQPLSRDTSLSVVRKSLQKSIRDASSGASLTRVWRRLTQSINESNPYDGFESSPSPIQRRKDLSITAISNESGSSFGVKSTGEQHELAQNIEEADLLLAQPLRQQLIV